MEEFKQLRRDQGIRDKISASFNYLRIHYKQLFKAIFVFAGPLLGISLIFMGSFYFRMFRSINTSGYMQSPFEQGTGNIILGYIIFLLVFLVIFLVIYEYMQLSEHKEKTDISLKDIFNAIKTRIGKYIVTAIGIAVVFAAIFLLSSVLPPFLSFFFILIPTIWLSVRLSIIFPIISFENTNPIKAINQSGYLMSGRWWSSLGLSIVSGIVSYAIIIAMLSPYLLLNIILATMNMGNNIYANNAHILLYALIIYYIIAVLIGFTFTAIVPAVNYLGLKEQKEEPGLENEINTVSEES